MEVDEVLAAIKEEDCEYVDLRFTDPRGNNIGLLAQISRQFLVCSSYEIMQMHTA